MSNYLTTDGATLAACTGAGVRIAVVDSGIADGHPHVGDISKGIALIGDDDTDVSDRLGHGTAVAAAIREKAPHAELIPVRVLDRQLSTSARVLARAIDWAVDAGVHIVNLSLGTTNDAHIALFEQALDAARDRGVVVISARSHANALWYPGSLPGALGIVASDRIPRNAVGVVPGTLGAGLEASPFPRPIPGVPAERNYSGVSFAVANASGIIALALEAGAPAASIDDLLSWITARAVPWEEQTG